MATVQTFIQDAPPDLQPAILQAVLEDTFIEDEGIEASSLGEISAHQNEIGKIISKGGFSIKPWERSGEDGVSKPLGMTWDCLKDHYFMKLRLNLQKKSRGIPSGADLDSEFLRDPTAPITKENFLPVACQFYDPTGLAAPLMFSVRSLFSEICRDRHCSFNSILSEDGSNKFRSAVNQVLPQPRSSWPGRNCASLPLDDIPSRTINLVTARPANPSSDLVNRHLNQLYPFKGVETAEPQEQIRGLAEDGAAGTLAPETRTQPGGAQNEPIN